MNLPLQILLTYWIPSYLYLLVWSIRLRQKHKLTDLNKLGESLVYASTCFLGLFIVFMVKPKDVKEATLP
tara:strand:+ start:67 stop:276 length:210 start_codon:yes stop_codon:yes gene_type:complete